MRLYLLLLLNYYMLCGSAFSVNDWMEAELTLSKIPEHPVPSLSSEEVANTFLRSLQLIDYPKKDAGLHRIYHFLTWDGRRSIVSSDDSTEDHFCQQAAVSPFLLPLMGALQIKLGPATRIPGTLNRGEVVSYQVTAVGSQAMQFVHKSGMLKNYVASEPPVTNLVLRLEQCRRPPLAGCWLVKGIADAAYAKGGLGWSRGEGV